MELQTSGMFYNGENNSKSIKIIVTEIYNKMTNVLFEINSSIFFIFLFLS